MTKNNILKQALATCEKRGQEYGKTLELFDAVAHRWSGVIGTEITAKQVVRCMIELKLARLDNNPKHYDSMVDVAGYTACLWEVSK